MERHTRIEDGNAAGRAHQAHAGARIVALIADPVRGSFYG